MIGIYSLNDFLTLCVTYSDFLDFIAQMLSRALEPFGVTLPRFSEACFFVVDALGV